MEFIQIHISEPIWTKLCTRLPLGLEETVGYDVWIRNSWPLPHFGPFFFGGHCRIMDTRRLPAQSWAQDGCRRDRFPRYPYTRDSSWCSRRRHRHEVVADGGVIRDSLISVILAGVPLTSRKWRCGTAAAAAATTTTTKTTTTTLTTTTTTTTTTFGVLPNFWHALPIANRYECSTRTKVTANSSHYLDGRHSWSPTNRIITVITATQHS